MLTVVHLLCNFASSANHDVSPPLHLNSHMVSLNDSLKAKYYHWNAGASDRQRQIRWGTLPLWEQTKEKCLESAHVSWSGSQGRMRALLWTEEDVKEAGRKPLSAVSQETKKKFVRWRWRETMSTWSQQGPLFVQVLLAPRRLPEPTRLYTFMQTELTGQQARMVTLARPSSISQFPPTDRV